MWMQVTDFKHGSVWPIMVVSYETLRKFADKLAGHCDILICDEGHRQASRPCNGLSQAACVSCKWLCKLLVSSSGSLLVRKPCRS